MKIDQIDTPALLIDDTIMTENLKRMQDQADTWNVALRPHTKTHKSPEIARRQVRLGASGITVAKTGEAEVMAAQGIEDIFIANEIIGTMKLKRICNLCSQGINISFGVDSIEAVQQIDTVFTTDIPAHILIEVETGENRSGVTDKHYFGRLLEAIGKSRHIVFDGIFSHEGHSYSAPDTTFQLELLDAAQRETLAYVELAKKQGHACKRVSIGSTPSLLAAELHKHRLMEGITEIRPGTYVFMDAGQAHLLGSFDRCAATVMATVISKPTSNRVIADAGAKALTMQSRGAGVCSTTGKGRVIWDKPLYVDTVYDEHTVINDTEFNQRISIGDRINIIPNHICPVVNLFDVMFLIQGDEVIAELPVSARGKTT